MKSFIERVKDIVSVIYYKESNRIAIENLNESKEILNEIKMKIEKKGSVNCVVSRNSILSNLPTRILWCA